MENRNAPEVKTSPIEKLLAELEAESKYIYIYIDSLKIKSARLDGEILFLDTPSIFMQKCAIEMALNKISQNELSYISEENFNNFYRTLYSSGDVKGGNSPQKGVCQKLDNFINNYVRDNRLKIKQIILNNIASEFQRYFSDVADYAQEPAKYHSFDEEWHEQKLQDSLTPYFYTFKNFLRGLDFDKQKDWLRECFDFAFSNSPLGFNITFRDACVGIITIADNFDELSGVIPSWLIFRAQDLLPGNYLKQMQILTQFLLEVKFFLLKRALYERGIVDTYLQGGKNLSYFVHFTDEDNLVFILNNGILSRKETKKRGIASKTNDGRRLDGALDYISVSITHPNKIVLNTFINKGSIKKPIYIYLDPFSVLSLYGFMDIIFCDKNAAASACEKGNSWLDFENIFAPSKEYHTLTNSFSYNRLDKEKYEPTDPQAEILVQNCIPKDAIAFILDSNGELIFERKE